MSSLSEALERAKASADFGVLADAIPYARFMGIAVEHANGELIGRLPYADMLIGNAALPALHGGAIGALLELTAIFQTLWEIEPLSFPKIVTITVEYLRSGRPVDTFAAAVVTRRGKQVLTVAARAWQDDREKPIALGNAHLLIAAKPSGLVGRGPGGP